MRLLLVIGLLQEAASFSTTGCSNPASFRARPALGLVPLLLPTTVRLNTKARPVLAKTFPTMPWSTLAAGSSDGIALSDTRLEKLWWFFWRSLWKGMTLPFPALRSMVLDVSQPQNASVGFRIRESLAAIVAYLGIGVLAYYCVLEPTWTVVDALYFTVTCFTTVGYGDLCPSTPQSQTFTALFGILGVAFLGAALATLSSKLVQTQVEVLQAVRETSKQRIKALFEQVSPLPMSAATTSTATMSQPQPVSQSNWQSPDSTRTADTVLLWRRVNALVWTLVRQILPPLLIIVGGAWLVHHLDAPTMMTRPWRDVVYYAVVTASTIGFGDICPVSQRAKLAAVVYIPLAVAAAGELLSGVATRILERRQKLVYRQQLLADLTIDNLKAMDANGDEKISRHEYIQFMLIEMGIADQQEFNELHQQFEKLDVDGSGFLDKRDLVKMARSRGANVKD
jgi:potassium channel subfamily K